MKTAKYLSEKCFRVAKQGTEQEYKRYKDLAEFKPPKCKVKKLTLPGPVTDRSCRLDCCTVLNIYIE